MYKYKNQTVVNAITNEKIELPPNVEKNKLFYGDTFVIDESNKIVITSSTIRQASEFPAVLCLRNNRTYGKQGTKQTGNNLKSHDHLERTQSSQEGISQSSTDQLADYHSC